MTGFDMDVLVGSLAIQPGTFKSRTANDRPGAGPKILHDVNRRGFFTGAEEHAIPGRCALLFVPPKENIGADTLFAVSQDCDLEPFFIIIGLGGAVVFNRRPPLGFAHLPMAGGAPLGYQVGTLP